MTMGGIAKNHTAIATRQRKVPHHDGQSKVRVSSPIFMCPARPGRQMPSIVSVSAPNAGVLIIANPRGRGNATRMISTMRPGRGDMTMTVRQNTASECCG